MTDLDAALVLLSLKRSSSQEFGDDSPNEEKIEKVEGSRDSPEPLLNPTKHLKVEHDSSDSSYGDESSPPELVEDHTGKHSFRVDPQGRCFRYWTSFSHLTRSTTARWNKDRKTHCSYHRVEKTIWVRALWTRICEKRAFISAYRDYASRSKGSVLHEI
jgi:hypothetical protein